MLQLEELDVWNYAISLAQTVYEESFRFPDKHQSILGDSLRKACLDYTTHISIAASRKDGNESLQYLNQAKINSFQIETSIRFARQIQILDSERFETLLEEIEASRRLLYGFIKHYKNSVNRPSSKNRIIE